MDFKHISVLLDETIDGLDIKPDGIYVDGTLGGAGHSKEIAKRLSKKGMLIGIDRDEEALKAAKENLKEFSNVKYVHGNHDEIDSKIKENLLKRKNSQPLEYPSAGSVFRNPEGNYAGKIIEELGLKGKNIGGAEISTKHANFIINKNNASSSDILNLIKLVQKEVKDKYKIDLKLEQQLVNW